MGYYYDVITDSIQYRPDVQSYGDQEGMQSQTPAQPSALAQGAGMAGNIGGMATGSYLGGQVSGLGAAGASAPIASSAASSPLVSSLAGSEAASAASSGAYSLSGIGSAGNVYLPAAGALGAYDLFKNKKHGTSGAAQGALSGAAIGSYGGPWGALIGAGVGAGVGYFGNFGDEDKWQTEQKNLKRLRDKGVNIGAMEADGLTKGRSKQQLIDLEKQKTANGQYGNATFAESRNESDLKPEDIWGYSAFFDKFGNDWLGKMSEQQRRDKAQEALNAGAVREHNGTISVDWNKLPQQKQTVELYTRPK